MSFGLSINNDFGELLSPKLTPICLYSINKFSLNSGEKKTIQTDIESDRPIIAFVRADDNQGCKGLLFNYVKNNNKWAVDVFSAPQSSNFVLYVFSNKITKISDYGFCVYNEVGDPVFHNASLPLTMHIFDTDEPTKTFDEDVAVQPCICEANGDFNVSSWVEWVPPKYGYVTVWEWVPPQYGWVNNAYVQIKPGYYQQKQVWKEIEPQTTINHWTTQTTQWTKIVCSGNKSISVEILWKNSWFNNGTGQNPYVPDWRGKFSKVKKIAYIKCDYYDKYFSG